jgi:restriction system protein
MLPVLQEGAQAEVSTRDVIERLAERIGLTEAEREHLLPSGKQRTFDNRVFWAKGYLKQAGLVQYTKRGYYQATDEGRKVLAAPPPAINVAFLQKYEAFRDFQHRKGPAKNGAAPIDVTENATETPDEILRSAYSRIVIALEEDLLDRIRNAPPRFFETLLIDLLQAMGYGSGAEGRAIVLGRSGDDGIDGVVDQDPLGVDRVYVQAKRYAEKTTVGPGAIRDFFGALNLKKTQKGIFVTTSDFTKSAEKTANDLGGRIVLINGERLAKLMVRYNVGCREKEALLLKEVDEEYFE